LEVFLETFGLNNKQAKDLYTRIYSFDYYKVAT